MTATLAGVSGIHIDEVGLAFAIIGGLRVQTAFQPVFSRLGQTLTPVALTASSVIRRDGGAQAEAGDLSARDRAAAARLAPQLAIRNLPNFDGDHAAMQLLVDLPARGDGSDDLATLLAIAESAGVSPRCLTFDISARLGAPDLPALMAAIADQGASPGVDLLGVSDFPLKAAPGDAALVRIPSSVFGRILSEASLRRLATPLVATLHKRGFLVQVEGVSGREALRLALAMGADRFQGNLIAPPSLAGAAFDSTPRRVADLVGNGGNVVPMSA